MSVLLADEQPEQTVLGVRIENAKRDSLEMMRQLSRVQYEAHTTGRDALATDIAQLWERQQQITAELIQIVSDEQRTAEVIA